MKVIKRNLFRSKTSRLIMILVQWKSILFQKINSILLVYSIGLVIFIVLVYSIGLVIFTIIIDFVVLVDFI